MLGTCRDLGIILQASLRRAMSGHAQSFISNQEICWYLSNESFRSFNGVVLFEVMSLTVVCHARVSKREYVMLQDCCRILQSDLFDTCCIQIEFHESVVQS